MVAEEESAAGSVRSICYADAGLAGIVSHHVNACRNIAGELRRRGIEVDILVNASVETGLADELSAQPAFRHYPYGRLTSLRPLQFAFARACFLSDLDRAARECRYDVVYVSSVLPPQMAGVIQWGQTRFSAAEMPPVIMEFGLPSGAGADTAEGWGQYAEQYQRAAACISEDYAGKFLFFTFDRAASQDYSQLLGFKVETLPAVYSGGEIRLRTGDEQGRPVVGFLGLQRREKGYHLIPDVLRLLLQKDVHARFLVHDGGMREMGARELRELAAADERVRFDQQPADKAYWLKLLDDTDIVVLPYDPDRYAASVSALAIEAVSCGLPVVSPNGTTMKTLAERYQNNAAGIADWTVESVADAIVEAVGNFPALARAAYEGAGVWVRENGAQAFVSRLLDFAENHRRMRPPLPTRPFDPATVCLMSAATANLKLRDINRWRRARRRRTQPAS